MPSEPLKPCPWCDVPATVMVCDEEGNIHDDGYEDDPWSGLKFALRHDEDNAGRDCPIATENGAILGNWLYDTREEAENAWNRRAADGTAK